MSYGVWCVGSIVEKIVQIAIGIHLIIFDKLKQSNEYTACCFTYHVNKYNTSFTIAIGIDLIMFAKLKQSDDLIIFDKSKQSEEFVVCCFTHHVNK